MFDKMEDLKMKRLRKTPNLHINMDQKDLVAGVLCWNVSSSSLEGFLLLLLSDGLAAASAVVRTPQRQRTRAGLKVILVSTEALSSRGNTDVLCFRQTKERKRSFFSFRRLMTIWRTDLSSAGG